MMTFVATLAGGVAAQDVISLPAAGTTERPATLMQALRERHSTREYAATELSQAELADLLWAAVGVNRPDEGKRTAPTAMNRQEVDVYVATAGGAYLYDAAAHSLKRVCTDDVRPLVAAGQDFAATAPVALIIVTDFQKLGNPSADRTRLMGAADAGIVSQNISLFCAAAGLATVPRATMDEPALRRALHLRNSQMPLLNHPVGHFKK